MHHLYLNGEIYGRGSLEYIAELIKSYIVDSEMYGQESCKFEIKKP